MQPTYPGDPNGPERPRSGRARRVERESGERDEPEPARLLAAGQQRTQNGTQCPANKLVVTPSAPIPDGTTFTVTINYTGRPGVHTDGDGSTEGWFRISRPPAERRLLRDDRAGRQRLVDADEQPSAGEADLRHLRHDEHRQGRRRSRRARRLHGAGRHDVPAGSRPAAEPARRELPGRLGDLALALAGADRELPRRELDRRLRPLGADEPDERHPVLGGPASTITAARKATNKIAMDNQEDIVNFQQISTGRGR